jgi:hypothetical protein
MDKAAAGIASSSKEIIPGGCGRDAMGVPTNINLQGSRATPELQGGRNMLVPGELETLAVRDRTTRMDDRPGFLGGIQGTGSKGRCWTHDSALGESIEDLRLLSDQEVESLLPTPLRYHLRFGRAYAGLLEVARCLPAAHVHVMMQAIGRTKMSSRHPSAALDTVVDLLIVALANSSDESFLTGFFYELLEPFDALPSRQKESLLAALEGVIGLSVV